MRLAIIGFGQMARAVLELLPYKDISCTHIVTKKPPNEPWNQHGQQHSIRIWHDIHLLPFNEVDVVLDFSAADGLQDRVKTIIEHNKPIVIGTTGWDSVRSEILETAHTHNASLLWGANFSVGVALFSKICAYAGRLFAPFSDFDVGIYERHHRQKADHPSGTALQIAEMLLQESSSKESKAVHLQLGKIAPEQLHIGYSRIGYIPGYHEVLFENRTDTTTLSHRTSSRSSFALGALEAALWLQEKKGVFHFMDMIDDKICRHEEI